MAVYKTREFARWARKQGLKDAALCDAVHETTSVLFEAELGGNLLKKRIRRRGQGKSAGFRTLIATNRTDLWFFLYGFAKNERSNITKDEESALKKLAAVLLAMPPPALDKALEADELMELNCDA